jgi:uncharacterized protein (UPF0276 family)
VQAIHPLYVHFPLRAGAGIGDALDSETNRPVDWNKVEALLAQTGTPQVNLHIATTVEDCPGIPLDTTDPTHAEMLVSRLIRDVRAVVERFGPERVVIENDFDNGGLHLLPTYLPQTLCRVVEETGCGLLLDVAHARIAARYLGLDVREYIAALPVARVREIHVTGVQRFGERWVSRLRRAGLNPGTIECFAGRPLDHLPMTGDDWELFAWAMERAHDGTWGRPWVVTFEYGGVGPLFEAVTLADALAEQIPRLYALVKG